MSELITRGLELAVFGMGTVFLFLTLLVLATMAMSSLVARFAPGTIAPEVCTPDTASDAPTMAAIAAAVRRYREGHRR